MAHTKLHTSRKLLPPSGFMSASYVGGSWHGKATENEEIRVSDWEAW
jgi:hypothetical protein